MICALAILPALPLRAQSVIEFPLPGSRLAYGIAAGPDGALWFTDFLGRVGRITTGGVVTEYTVAGNLEGIVAGPDGNLWFTDIGGAQVGRITTSGVVTRFPVSGGTARITVGSDGALWVTDQSANKIGRVTTAGAVTEYSIPTSNSTPEGIAAGSDGALWFTEFGAGKIGRITTAGSITEFPIPTGSSGPRGIAAGSDGNLWFNESGASKIARITTAGVFTEFPLLSTTRNFDIAAGPDGNLWFTEYDANRIGRITTAGVITEFFVTTSSSNPIGIAPGPDGSLWFTEFSASKIGRVAPPGSTPGARFYTLTPCRVIDTRNPSGSLGGPALIAGTDRLFQLAGACGIPSTAQAVAINAAVTQSGGLGHLSVYPGGSPLPLVSFINYSAGQTRANNGILALGSGGYVIVHCGQSSGTVHLILDASGYFQ
jgi:streptogramin lyase